MKVAVILAQVLLALPFVVFGLNGFLNFLPAQLPPGDAGAFAGAMMHSHFVYLVSGVQVIAGALLLLQQFVPLALVLLGAEIANILTYHLTMAPQGAQVAIFVALLWAFLFWAYRGSFAGLFARRAKVRSSAAGAAVPAQEAGM
jgi:putative oxidoreductase